MQDKPKKEPTLEELKNKINELEKIKEEYLANWQRARADLINYKKEEEVRINSLLDYVAQGLALKLLPILDNFEIAESKLPPKLKTDEHVKGLIQIKSQVQSFLKGVELEEINSLGEKFDPNWHEAVEEIESKEKESGLIVEEIQKGYKIKGHLIRPAKVKIIK